MRAPMALTRTAGATGPSTCRGFRAGALCAALVAAWASTTPALGTGQEAPPSASATKLSTRAEREAFLSTAPIVRAESASKGVTGTLRVTLSDGVVTHDASVQTIDERRLKYETPKGVEMNFKDSWRFNVAAYRIDRLLDIGMIPATVERLYKGRRSSFTWWVEDVLMDEEERQRQKLDAPNQADWEQQFSTVRLFDELIANIDRNKGNLLIDKGWNMWMIDHSRAFRTNGKPRSPGHLLRAERSMLDRLRRLDLPAVREAVSDYLTNEELGALMKRRDYIVEHFDKTGPKRLFDRPPRCC